MNDDFLAGYYTLTEVCEIIGVNPATFYRWRRKGIGPKGLKLGRRVYFHRDDITAWLESRKD